MIGPWQREPGYRVATKSLAQIRTTAITVREILKVTGANIDNVELLENKLRSIGIHFHIVEPQRIPGEAARAARHRAVDVHRARHGGVLVAAAV